MRSRLIGAFTAALALVAVVLAFHPPALPWTRPLHVHLEAGAFGQLNRGAGVELGGVKVGRVSSIDYRNGRALILLEIDQPFGAQLHSDAGAWIRPHGLLGPKYIDLQAGKQGNMSEGATIPLSRVQVSTDVDQVINSLQPDVRQNLQVFLVEMGRASDGRGDDMNFAFKALGQSALDLTTTATTIKRRDDDLAEFFAFSEQLNRDLQYAPLDAQIRDTDQVLSGLVQVDSSIGGTVDHMAGVMRGLDIVMSGNSGNLADTLAKAPVTLTRLRTAAVAADGFVTGVNPALPYFMTAVMETKSAFASADAAGHYVHVITVVGPCTGGAPGPCGSAAGYKGPTANNPQARPQSSVSPGVGDQELASLFLGG